MGNKFTDAVHNLRGLTSTQKAVLNVLAFHADNKTGECWPSVSTIASKSEFGRTAVKDSLKALRDMGIILIVGSKPSRFGEVNVYKITADILQPGYCPTQSSSASVVSRFATGSSDGSDRVVSRPQNSSGELVREDPSTVTAASQTGHSPDGEESKTPRFGHIGSSALSLLAIAEHIHCITGMPEIRVNDPVLPLLVNYTDEKVAHYETLPVQIPPPSWDWNIQHSEEAYDTWIEVKPGDPRYPNVDTPLVDNGLSRREAACNDVWCRFTSAVEILAGLAQYLPNEIRNTGSDLPPGALEVSDEAIDVVMRKLLGFPDGPLCSFNTSVADFWAATHWAFKKSNYWPSRLKTVGNVISSWPEILKQYERYYARLPEGKKPHDLGVGRPLPEDRTSGEEGGQR